jgi:hypothetical protein
MRMGVFVNILKVKKNFCYAFLMTIVLLNLACQETIQTEILVYFNEANSKQTYHVQEDDEDTKQYKKDLEEIQTLSRKSDIKGLLELKDKIAKRWKNQMEIFFILTSDICKALNSYNFRDTKQYLYARQCAKQLLNDSDKLPINLEREMVGLLQEVEEYRLGVVPQTGWKKDREERVKFLLHLRDRLEKNIDRSFDFNDPKNRPVGNVCVPAPNYSCGIRPEDVKEREIRAKYIAAIEANTVKAQKLNLQIQLHRLDRRMPDFVDQFLIGMYSQPPLDLTELEKNLRLFNIEGERKEKILKSVNESFQK